MPRERIHTVKKGVWIFYVGKQARMSISKAQKKSNDEIVPMGWKGWFFRGSDVKMAGSFNEESCARQSPLLFHDGKRDRRRQP